MRTRHRAAIVAVPGAVVLAAMGLAAPPVAADTVADSAAYLEGYTVHYTGGAVTNDVVVTVDAPWEEFTEFTIDDTVPIVAGHGCEHPDAGDATRVVCTSYYAEPDMNVDLGDGDDTYRASGPFSASGVVRGGAGDDHIEAGGEIHGGYGDDRVVSSGGISDAIYGGRGHDVIQAGYGDDLVYGNSGEDEIRGGTGDDELYGGPDADVVYGNSGADLIRGGPGADDLSGGPGGDDVVQ